MMRILSRVLLVLVSLGFVLTTAMADEMSMSKVAKDKQNVLGLYVTSREAHDQMKMHGNKILFLDIRDPVELHVTGMPSDADYNVAFKLINTKKWDKKKSKFKLESNPNFIADVADRLKAKGLNKNDKIITFCGSGKRAAKAVNALAKAGYMHAYSVVDGMKGWSANKLPIDKKLDRKKIYGNP